MGTVVTIQPEQTGDVLPYPWHINQDGYVQRQEFWRGHPAQLVGFAHPKRPFVMRVTFEDFWADPEACIGLWPIFADADGVWNTHQIRIDSAKALAGEGR